ncbi:MAG: BatD family protein [Ferruginibacter sp.]
MMRSFVQKNLIFIFLLAGLITNAQVKFSASISPAEIGKDEYAQLKLIVENAKEVQQITPPDLKNFTILSGPNQESGMSMVNGTVKKYIALSFLIQPRSTGNFIIPPARARADGVDLKSNVVNLKVLKNPTGNNAGSGFFSSPFSGIDPFEVPAPRASYDDYILRKGENPVEKVKKNMFVQVEVDRKSVYVGEPVIATYKLYTRLQSESNMIKNPSFNGFSVLDMQGPGDMSSRTEKYGGREYNVYSLRKVQLYPLLAGNLELGAAEIENNVRFIKAEFAKQQPNLFDELFQNFSEGNLPPAAMEVQKIALQSKPLTIVVKPLPANNKPPDFKGAVGKFNIEARVENDHFSTDDAGRMAIFISGEGNLQMINAPSIAWPSGIEGFESKATDDLFKGTVPVSGRKIFEYPFTVSKAGSYSLPAVRFSFFDIRDASYKTITTKPINISVSKGSGKPKRIQTDGGQKSRGNYLTRFFDNRLRVVSLFAVLMIIGLIVWLKRDSRTQRDPIETAQAPEEAEPDDNTPIGSETKEILLAQENPLLLTEACLQNGDRHQFYTQLNLELKNYLSKKLVIPAEALNRKNIGTQLDLKGVSNETSVQLEELMDAIEWQLYTPLADDRQMKDIFEKANDLIQLMNTYRS